MSVFRITGGKGFHVTFENGYTVSVQFGGGNYCDNYDMAIGTERNRSKESSTAECAVWAENGSLIEMPEWSGDTVGGYMTPAQVLTLLNWAAAQ